MRRKTQKIYIKSSVELLLGVFLSPQRVATLCKPWQIKNYRVGRNFAKEYRVD